MTEKKRQFDKITNVYLTGISGQMYKFGIGLLFIQFLSIPVLAHSVDYYEGYNVITYDDGSKDIINGALNFYRWDGVWRPNDELNISNGSWPYSYSENATTANFNVDDTTLSIPTANTIFKLKENSISYKLTFSKAELQRKQISINLTDAFIDLQYSLKSRKTKNKYMDKYKIKYDRLEFNAGEGHISIHDDTLRDWIEGGEIFQDVTYLFPKDYKFEIENGQIRLKFKKNALNKLTGNVTIEIRTWYIIGPKNWGGNVTFYQATDVKSTGNAELKQTVTDYALYTRFDEDDGTKIYTSNPTIYNENILTKPFGELYLNAYHNPYTAGKYGQAIHFDGQKNKVIFLDDPAFQLRNDFTISFYIKRDTGDSNSDADITRKGSTNTVSPKSWWKVEIKSDYMQGVIQKNGIPSTEKPILDTQKRMDNMWHFVAFTRQGNTCSLYVDDTAVPVRSKTSTTECPTNFGNTALLAIGSKDTEDSSTGKDYTHGTLDEVRFFNYKLSSAQLTSIKNNEHLTSGTVTRSLGSIIPAGQEIKELGCYGTWDRSTTKVDVMASTNNVNWDMIQLNAYPNVNYTVNTGNNYKYTRCSLSTTNASRTPIIESIRARISSSTIPSQSTIPPQPRNLQYTLGNYWVNHTWQAGTGVVTDSYNISVNGVWHNRTNPYYNDSVGASNWSDITIWAWNRSGSGNRSALSVNQNIQAPSGFINGTVMNSVNKSGLVGVNVFTNTSLSTVTDANGFYSFEVASGDYNITATFEPMYYPNSTIVTVSGASVVKDIEILKKPTGNITGSVNS